MQHSRITNLFRLLDAQLSKEILDILDRQRDLCYAFAFTENDEEAGVFCVYRQLAYDAPNARRVPVQRDWFYENRVWFRQIAVAQQTRDKKYEAYIEYVDTYRDDVIVDINAPIITLAIASLRGKASISAEDAIAPFRLHPVSQFSLLN